MRRSAPGSTASRAMPLPADDRGLQYGDGIVRDHPGAHGQSRDSSRRICARLASGCARLGIRFEPMRRAARRDRARRWRWRRRSPCSRSSSRAAAPCGAATRRRAPSRRDASCRCGPQPPCRTPLREGVALRMATFALARQPRARRHQTSQPARERDGRRRGRRGRRLRCAAARWRRARDLAAR